MEFGGYARNTDGQLQQQPQQQQVSMSMEWFTPPAGAAAGGASYSGYQGYQQASSFSTPPGPAYSSGNFEDEPPLLEGLFSCSYHAWSRRSRGGPEPCSAKGGDPTEWLGWAVPHLPSSVLPPRAELGIDIGGILKKTRAVLFHRTSNKVLEELDMGGALVFIATMAGLHLLVGPPTHPPLCGDRCVNFSKCVDPSLPYSAVHAHTYGHVG